MRAKKTVRRGHGSQLADRQGLILVDLNDLLTAIRTAFGANAMRDMILAAAFAFNQVVQGQGIMSAPAIPP